MMFEYEKALERFMGEKDILIEVLPIYIENLDISVDELKTLTPETQSERIREVAHSIKGSSLNLDAVPLGRAAEELEDLAYNKKSSGISELVEKIAKLSAETKKEMNTYLV
jgi:two-component system, sensor histidine kinase and response regulator